MAAAREPVAVAAGGAEDVVVVAAAGDDTGLDGCSWRVIASPALRDTVSGRNGWLVVACSREDFEYPCLGTCSDGVFRVRRGR